MNAMHSHTRTLDAHAAGEPTLDALRNPALRYFLATRPAFLSVSLFGCLVGLGTAHVGGYGPAWDTALFTILFALIAHAGINVINDYYDELGGTDRINTDRVFPFTGGSRFIQNGVMGVRETLAYAGALFAVVVLAGVWLTARSGPGLLAVGAAGLFIGWAYSATPLKLNSRGMGELCVAVGFALLAVGADFVQRAQFSWAPWYAVAAYALLVTNVLYMNQFPDYAADKAAGKHHWVVRLGTQRARWGYVAIVVVAYAWFAVALATGLLPALAALALLSLPLSIAAAAILLKHAAQPRLLAPAIKLTIAAASVHGLLLSVALLLQG